MQRRQHRAVKHERMKRKARAEEIDREMAAEKEISENAPEMKFSFERLMNSIKSHEPAEQTSKSEWLKSFKAEVNQAIKERDKK